MWLWVLKKYCDKCFYNFREYSLFMYPNSTTGNQYFALQPSSTSYLILQISLFYMGSFNEWQLTMLQWPFCTSSGTGCLKIMLHSGFWIEWGVSFALNFPIGQIKLLLFNQSSQEIPLNTNTNLV